MNESPYNIHDSASHLGPANHFSSSTHGDTGAVGEVRGHGGVEEQVALGHVLAEVALHHAGVDEVFEEGGFTML